MKESDITAFLLIYRRIEHAYIDRNLDDWCYYGDANRYKVTNFYGWSNETREKLNSSIMFDEALIDKRNGLYTEREALEIIVKHWLENERI